MTQFELIAKWRDEADDLMSRADEVRERSAGSLIVDILLTEAAALRTCADDLSALSYG